MWSSAQLVSLHTVSQTEEQPTGQTSAKEQANPMPQRVVVSANQALFSADKKGEYKRSPEMVHTASLLLEKPQVIGKCFCCRHKSNNGSFPLDACGVAASCARGSHSLPPRPLPLSDVTFF